MTKELELVCVQKCYGMDVAEIFRSKLEAMDVPVMLEYDSAGKLYGLTTDGLGEVRVMVPKSYAAEAKALLSDAGEFAGTDATEEPEDTQDEEAAEDS